MAFLDVGALPPGGYVHYNGLDFGPATETIGFSVQPIPDGSGRTSIANKYTLRIRTTIARTTVTALDLTMDQIRERLTAYGGVLIYRDKGFGEVEVNIDFTKRSDIMWGPKPTEISWKPVGGNLAVELVWQVEFALSDCVPFPPFGNPMEFVWDVTYSQDRNRLTTRSLKGYIRIPNRKFSVNDRSLLDSVDLYYEACVPPIRTGFRRESETRSISRDKTTLDFSTTDVQVEYPLPPGCMEANIQVTATNQQAMVFTNWTTTISADYKLALGVQPAWSFWLFWKLIEDRIGSIKSDVPRPGNANALVGGAGGAVGDAVQQAFEQAENPPWFRRWIRDMAREHKAFVLPVSLNYTEQPMERRCQYSATFALMYKLNVILPAMMWRPIPFHNHTLWAQSLRFYGATKPRGYTQEVLRQNYDFIVDLCAGNPDQFLPPPSVPVPPGQPSFKGILKGKLLPEESWLDYKNGIKVSIDGKTVGHSPLPAKQKKAPKPIDPALSLGQSWAEWIDRKPWYIPDEVWNKRWQKEHGDGVKEQKRAKPTIEVSLIGRALRAQFPINPPQLIMVGDREALAANRPDREYFYQQVVANAGYPIYAAMWSQRFLLDDLPESPVYVPGSPKASLEPSNDTLWQNSLG